MTNVNTLFDFSKFEKKKTANQQEFESTAREILIDFKGFVPDCFKKLHRIILSQIEPIDQDKNLQAVVMSGYLTGQFKRKYPQLCGKATRQRFKLIVASTSVYVKKLNEGDKLPSNIPTIESVLIHNNLTDTKDASSNIFLGYTVADDWSLITGIYAVCIEGEKLVWVTDLANFGEDEQSPVITMAPNPIAPKVKDGVKIKIKKTKNE